MLQVAPQVSQVVHTGEGRRVPDMGYKCRRRRQVWAEAGARGSQVGGQRVAKAI